MRLNSLCCLLLVTLLRVTANAQNATGFNTADTLAMHFVKSIRATDKEKVMLQTDRKVYAAGEKIWFKAFVLHTLNNRLDTMSKNLFVDLVNDDDVVIKQLVLNAATLHTDGAILLGDSLSTGYYWLRGYTQNILQTDSSAICVQPLYVKNLAGSRVLTIDERRPGKFKKPVVQFFPEGGTLITGINSTGALQVKDGYGNPLVVSGAITDASDSLIVHFTTNKLGLARITFYPLWYKKYFAVMNINGQQIKYPLAEWNPFSAQIAVTRQTPDVIQAYITLEDSIYSRKLSTYVLGISRDSVCFAGIGRGMYQVDVPTANFPGGIATLLLFDEHQRLLSERKVFIDKDNYKVNITPDKGNYTARDKAHINIELTDATGRPLVSSLNIAVQDNRLMDMSDEIKADTIQPSQAYEMNDWLKRNKSIFTAADIDLMMLAHQPSFANWQQYHEVKNNYTDNTSLLLNLQGKVVNRRQEPLKQKVVTALSITGTNPYLALDTTNDGGGFQLPLPVNRENLLVKLQVKNKHDVAENDSIVIINFPFPNFATPSYLKQTFAPEKKVVSQRLSGYHIDTVFIGIGKEWLKPVIVKATTQKPTEVFDEKKRMSSFSFVLTQEKLKQYGAGSIGNALLMIPGMSLKHGQLVLFGGGGWMDSTSKSEPLLVIDGVRLSKDAVNSGGSTLDQTVSPVMSYLSSFSYQDIDFIEVLRGGEASMYGLEGGNGVILINTKSRRIDEYVGPSKIVQPVTYHVAPKFIMPEYDLKQVKNSKAPDPRTTVYWNGNIITGVDGKASVDFFTADEPATYTVVVSGITANGEYINKRITLNRK